MITYNDFHIVVNSKKVKVTSILKDAQIYFEVHLQPTVTIAEFLINEQWCWVEAGKGETDLAAMLGNLIEDSEI